MKNWIIKWNIVMVLLMVLFAGVTLAEESEVPVSESSETPVWTIERGKTSSNPNFSEVTKDGKKYLLFQVDQAGYYLFSTGNFRTGDGTHVPLSTLLPASDSEGALVKEWESTGWVPFYVKGEEEIALALRSGTTYAVELPEDVTWYGDMTVRRFDTEAEDEALELYDNDVYSNRSNLVLRMDDLLKSEAESAASPESETEDTGNTVEAVITYVFQVTGDVFLSGIRKLFGNKTLTITALVFNRFDATRIRFFQSSAEDSNVTKNMNTAITTAVNFWYNKLLTFTFIVYIIILVYIGIRIVASIGTPAQDKALKNVGNWVAGLAMLLLMPYFVFPLLFQLNDAFVAYIGKDIVEMKSYSEVYTKYSGFINGGDSITKAIKKLQQERDKEYDNYLTDKSNIEGMLNAYTQGSLKDFVEENVPAESQNTVLQYTETRLKALYSEYEMQRKLGLSHEVVKNQLKNKYFGESGLFFAELSIQLQGSTIGIDISERFKSGPFEELVNIFQSAYASKTTAEEMDDDIRVLKSDLMTQMRAMAGEYHRFIFVLIWWILIFQLITLTILYYKRIFVIAILIAIFPLVMLFYCIDKMADGKAQTLTMWWQEFLTNIFIQSIHALIYSIVVEMGLTIYLQTGNWIFFLGATLLLVPAEKIMREIMNLNGSTVANLASIGQSMMKAAIGIGAIRAFAKAGKTGKDKSIKAASNRRFNRLQRSQNRADAKAMKRDANQARAKLGNLGLSTPQNAFQKTKQKITGIANATRNSKFGQGVYKARNAAYRAGTATRKFTAKAAPKVARVGRAVRNVTATTAGALYGISGGSVESMAQGAQVAKMLSGKTSDDKKKPDIKTELTSAYERRGRHL